MVAEPRKLKTNHHLDKARALLRALVPRAQFFCFYDPDGNCIWSSDGTDDFEVDALVGALAPDAVGESSDSFLRRTLQSGRTILMIELPRSGGSMIGHVVVVFSKNAGKSSSFDPASLRKMLTPALEMIADSLAVQHEMGDFSDQLALVERELSLVYEIDEKVHGTSRSHAGLAHLVGQSGRFLSIAYSVLLIPGKRIRISATHSSWKNVNRRVMDRYLVEQILPRLEGRRTPVVFEIPPVDGSSFAHEQGYQTLVCPLLDKTGSVEGVLAQLGRVNNQAFTSQDRRFMSFILRKVQYFIEQSFDAMTGLVNRGGFEAQLTESWEDLADSGDQHQLIYMDLDNLQLVNDTFGRSAGDEVIVRFARLVEEQLPKSAVLSRLTGDDFCILITHAEGEAALELAHSIREAGAALRYLEGDRSLQITISLGIAECEKSQGSIAKALTNARLACDAAKDHGRDRIEVFDDNDQSLIRRHDDMQLVAQIQQTIDENDFQLLAQRIAALGSNDDRPRYEILLRMSGGDGEQVSSKSLFSAAERYSLMPQIDRWVISQTIARLAEHRFALEGRNAVFSINLSGQSLSDDDILEFIEDELAAADLDAHCLGFEVTESAAVSNLAKAQGLIDALHDRGCGISLDDFGAGLSSFAYLKNFRVDTLKIDGSFIRDITENRISESMVAAITQVAKVMNLVTVAEYVETEASRALVKELGVNFAQGHAIGRPEPLSDVLDTLGYLLDESEAEMLV